MFLVFFNYGLEKAKLINNVRSMAIKPNFFKFTGFILINN
jgi:hypothetical protein